MGKRTVKVKLPIYKLDEFITLCEKLIAKHTKLGAKSQLKAEEVAVLIEIVNNAKELRAEALDLHNQAENKMEQARIKLGVNKGQNSNTPGTAYYLIAKFRDLLLSENRSSEEQLSEYGFKVVIGQAKSPKKESISSSEIQ